jgi:hypothetical protein
MVRVEGVVHSESDFKGRKAAQTFKKQTHCCNDSPFAVVFAINLCCIGWLAAYTFAEGGGLDGHMQRLAGTGNMSSTSNSTTVLFGVSLQDVGVYNKFTNWVENQLALVERDVQANFDGVAMVGVLGICIGIVWLQLLKRLTSFMVHLTMMLVVVMTAALGFLFFEYADGCLVHVSKLITESRRDCVDLRALTEGERDVLRVVSYVIWVVAAALFLAICVLRSKVSLTVTIFQEAANSCLTNMGIYPVTMIVLLLVLAVHVVWVSTGVYLYSKPQDSMVGISFIQETELPVRLVLMYLVFSYFWVVAFVRALFRASVAGIVGNWYFNRHHAAQGSPLLSWWRPLWANLTVSNGSLAFGALCVGICSFLRYVSSKIERWTKRQPTMAALCKCFRCCMCCVEKCVGFVNKYAYVYVAMERCTFCSGAKKSFELISQFPVQLIVMKAINGFVLLCGKLLLTATMVITFVLMLERLDRDFCGLFVFVVGVALFQVFRMQANLIDAAADTVFVCYVMDLSLNNGEAVHLKNSAANLHEKVQAAVADYERDYPHEIELQKGGQQQSDDSIATPISAAPRP